ncbi:transposase [Tabrizicola soli]|uniref:Transposase n=1 Tax=Tabrizicola soli TaxID=2185115 RepID=A0ABV7E123_9RHOB|nr:transposase [Tabrizicola soli]
MAMLDTQVGGLERWIESVIAGEETSAVKARLLLSIPGIGPVSAAMLIAGMPELGRMTSGEAAAMTGLAPIPHDSGTMRAREQSQEVGAHCGMPYFKRHWLQPVTIPP